MSGREQGFTLVEVLIAMFIFSLISTGAYVALAATLDARDASKARISEVEQLAAMRRLLAEDVSRAVIRADRDPLGDALVDPDALAPDRLALTRRGRPNPAGSFARGDLLRVEWRVDNGQLVRRFLPHENPAQGTEPVTRTVLDGVTRMDVRRVVSNDILARIAAQSGGDVALPALVAEQGEASEIGAIDIRLTHADGTTTRHLLEWDPQ